MTADSEFSLDRSIYRLAFHVNAMPKMNLAANARHWGHYRGVAAAWRKLLVAGLADALPPKPLERARILLIRQSCVVPDYDNVSYSFKPIVDALGVSEMVSYRGKESYIERCDILENDDIIHLERRYTWQKSHKRNTQGIVVYLESL